jgi:hypothetical protein
MSGAPGTLGTRTSCRGEEFNLLRGVVPSVVGMAQGSRSERVVEALNQLCTSRLHENYARAVDLTHPKVIQCFGRREKAIAAFKSGLAACRKTIASVKRPSHRC